VCSNLCCVCHGLCCVCYGLFCVCSSLYCVCSSVTMCCSVFQCVSVCFSVLQCVAVCCSTSKQELSLCCVRSSLYCVCSGLCCVCCGLCWHHNCRIVLGCGAATRCNTLQRSTTHCIPLQHTVIHCNALQRTATHCNALQRTATHCNTLQHTATHERRPIPVGWQLAVTLMKMVLPPSTCKTSVLSNAVMPCRSVRATASLTCTENTSFRDSPGISSPKAGSIATQSLLAPTRRKKIYSFRV